jgi:hypothetical protein
MKQLRFIDPYSMARAGAVVGLGFTALIELPLMGVHLLKQVASKSVVSREWLVLLSKGSLSLLIIPSFIFISLMIAARFYNWYAKKFGGIEVDLC